MTTPYPAPVVFPDIEAVLIPWLQAQMTAVYGVQARVAAETPENMAQAVPLIAVARSAGADIQAVIDRPVVDVDCFAVTRYDSGQLARQAHLLMHRYLPGTVTGGAVIGMVNTVKGPGWMTYQDLDVRRSNATYEIYQHPAPA